LPAGDRADDFILNINKLWNRKLLHVLELSCLGLRISTYFIILFFSQVFQISIYSFD
jgi:hypothetical protein